jgi:hypothetical protein
MRECLVAGRKTCSAWKAQAAGMLELMLTVALVVGVLVLLVLVGARGLGGRARMSEQVSDRTRAEMDRQFEKLPDQGDLL